MRRLRDAIDPVRFFEQVRCARHRVLVLDYDGTLAPFHSDPDQAHPYPGVPEALGKLQGQGQTRLVMLTGRDAHGLLRLLRLPRPIETHACHGFEHLSPSGDHALYAIDKQSRLGLAEALAIEWEVVALGGRMECKPASLAVHWRGLPAEKQMLIQSLVQLRWSPIAAGTGLRLQAFEDGLELRPAARDKGSVIRQILRESGDSSAVAFLGDDSTDEDAFLALRGQGLGVLVRPELRSTGADAWIRPPEELLQFLDRWSRALQTGGEGCTSGTDPAG